MSYKTKRVFNVSSMKIKQTQERNVERRFFWV